MFNRHRNLRGWIAFFWFISYTVNTGICQCQVLWKEKNKMAKMKLQKIADLSLKNMIITYHDTNRTRFDMDFFTTLFTEETQDHITNALQVLESDG